LIVLTRNRFMWWEPIACETSYLLTQIS
jgi:hypothetical protein